MSDAGLRFVADDTNDKSANDKNDDITLVDLLLGEGSPQAQSALRQKVTDEPLLALEMAETVALLEQFRQVGVEPSACFAGRLAQVVQRAQRRVVERRTPWWVGVVTTAAAAVVAFAALWQWGPRGAAGGCSDERARSAALDLEPPGAPLAAAPSADTVPVVRESSEVAWESVIETMRRRLEMEASPRLGEALSSGLAAPADPLGRWLDPRNALVLLRLDHELRASTELRRSAMRSYGGFEAADARVQGLADRITTGLAEVVAADAASLAEVALAVRALIAAGSSAPARTEALAAGSDWLVARLPAYTDVNLVEALTPLVEVAAVRGTHVATVGKHGTRLVETVLRGEDAWDRRRPVLLTGTVAPATLANAGRLLRLLPGFGVDAVRCGIVRQLVLGRLQERRDAGEDGPELLVAIVYGCGDLLAETERGEIESQLSRWKPVRLVPDFVTVQQYAWAIEPGRLGFTRLQRDLRRLAALPAPDTLAEQAAFCLGLATNYAAFHDRERLRIAFGE